MLKATLALSLSFAALISACGKDKKISSNYQESITYYTHGSPIALVSGATANTTGLLASADLNLYQNYHLMGVVAFVEKSRISTVTNFAEVEDENRTDGVSSGGARQVPVYAFGSSSSAEINYSPLNDPRSPVFTFDRSAQDIKLLAINNQAVEVLHYSLKADKSAFSILVKHSQGNSGTVITAYFFGSTATFNDAVESDGDYQFLSGSEKITWDVVPEVKLCGTYSAAVAESVKKSVHAWGADPLAGASPLNITYTAATSYPPFSDLNSHCIYVVSSFDQSDSNIAKTLGITLPIMNLASRKIIDSDVFLFADLIGDKLALGEADQTTMHEMGHFFGLGHDFRVGANGKALHDTIMGYSQGSSTITEWDFAAIRDLYDAGFVVTP